MIPVSSEDQSLWRLAESLSIRINRRQAASANPSARVGRAGQGLDFMGYRPYRFGDDVRHVDWALYARHRSTFVREFEDDSLGCLTILIDATGSMAVGEPAKWMTARRIAAVFAYATLRALHAVVVGVAIDGTIQWLPRGIGRDFGHRLSSFLTSIEPAGTVGPEGVNQALLSRIQPSHVLVLSDFLDQASTWTAIPTVTKTPVSLCRISAAREFQVPEVGAYLCDSEGLNTTRQIETEAQRKKLQAGIASYRNGFEKRMSNRPGAWCDVTSDEALELVVQRVLTCVNRQDGYRRSQRS
ncbi:MAG: DUF58 domain-containing protein [Myxococcota bacterium]|nr:DUF58 domain-containing protein [Myxococcota bacterium]